METRRQGDTGASVQILQLALQRAGYYQGALDGIFGGGTRRAVERYQQNYRLVPDGVAGPKTWEPLLVYLKGYFKKRVQPGDTFWRMAQDYGTTEQAIATANPGSNSSNLQVGALVTIPLGFPVTPTNVQYTYQLMQLVTEGLGARYPFIRTGSIGRSVMGNELVSLTIGSGTAQVFYNGAHHANEWITTPVLLRYLEEYATAYAAGGAIYGASAASLYAKTSLTVVPMVNPDGVDLVAGVLNSGPYFEQAKRYAANYPAVPFPSGWKANIDGVDTNLQYPAEWEKARAVKFAQGFVSPGPRDYVGSAPLVAPESKAVYDLTRRNKFRLILAYHTQGELIFWKFLNYLPPRSYEIARKMGEASGYLVEETPAASGYAGYKDWFIQTYNRPGYTIEAGKGVNPLPSSQFDTIYRDNVGILTLGMTQIITS